MRAQRYLAFVAAFATGALVLAAAHPGLAQGRPAPQIRRPRSISHVALERTINVPFLTNEAASRVGFLPESIPGNVRNSAAAG